VVAAGVGLGIGELASGLFPRSVPSPVVAVGDAIIDLTPGSAVRTGIDSVGRADKPLLIAAVVVASLLLGAVIASPPGRTVRGIVAGFAGLGAVAVWASARETHRNLTAVFVVQVLAVAAAAAVAVGLRRLVLPGRTRASSPASPVAGEPAGRDGRRTGPTARTEVASPLDPPATRRAFMAYAGAGAAFAAVAALGGQKLRGRSSAASARAAVALPPPVSLPASPGPDGTFDAVPGISGFVTPNADFYRIDTALLVPQVTPDHWQLHISGLVERPLTFTLDELLAMPLVEEQVTLSCVSNEVGGDLVGNASWRGVPLLGLLQQAGIKPEATQVIGESVDGFTAGFPTAVLDGRPALVAVGMNGEPLPLEHGFPARLVVPGLYGYVSATKWLSEIRLTSLEDEDGYWIPRGWSKDGPIKTQSRIDVPRKGTSVTAGTVPVAGVAWAPTRGISRVEVQVDDGPWQAAELAPVSSDLTWVQWLYRWPAPSGRHQLTVRATDGTGAVQSAERSDPAPNGATGYHSVRVNVA
jgi:DMSO/TMAO reductase YedYZ molybdopterin-dependent catalytic subunit